MPRVGTRSAHRIQASSVASRTRRYEIKEEKARQEWARRENALTACAFDDMLMDIAVVAMGLVAKGARTCYTRRYRHTVSQA